MNRIQEKFQELQSQKRAALMPYLPLGYPTLDLSHSLIRAVQDAGADLIELGIPFSDPLADGPVIQHAAQVALQNGVTLRMCLEIVLSARDHGVNIPLILMGYYNPILRYDLKNFARDAFEVGVDGVIIPDLPVEEARDIQHALQGQDMDLILLAAPTSDDARLKKIGKETRGFLYLVSVTGVTCGACEGVPEGLPEFIQRARAATNKPVCVGFGISTPDTARQIGALADGVIVGSALVAKIGEPATATEQATAFVDSLREALNKP